jgi:amidase
MNRRAFLTTAASASSTLLGGWALAGCARSNAVLERERAGERERDWATGAAGAAGSFADGFTIEELQRLFESNRLTAQAFSAACERRIQQIDRGGPRLNSVLEINPEVATIARALDEERRRRGPRGRLHGIPVLLKDNLDTHDRMMTTAGSLALSGSIAPRDSFVAERLRQAGAIILGKTNLSEWANFRGSRSISGWSGRGGQTRNPYCTACSPSGSSSGSAVAVAASLCTVAVGTETNGSIVSPASYCGIVGIKPTVGLVSRAGIIPISSSQDTAGPMARNVADAAALLSVMAGPDPRDPATADAASRLVPDYARSLDPGALQGARLGLSREMFKMHRSVDPVLEQTLAVLRRSGTELIDSIKLPSRQDLGGADRQVMLYEFKDGLNAYFASLGAGAPLRSLDELIEFNERHRDRELNFFGQETLIEANAKGPLSDSGYRDAKTRCREWSAKLSAVFVENRLDAIIAPTSGPAHALDYIHGDRGLGGSSSFAAVAGLPHITVPCGQVRGLPVGLSFFGPAWTEARLIALAYAFEQGARARLVPRFIKSIEELA